MSAFPEEVIIFNAKGLNHIFYKSTRSRRKSSEISIRIKLLPRAIKLLNLMPLPQEESEYKKDGKMYNFWAFEGVIDNKRIKVIVRQIGNGKKHFWSVIPYWRKTKFGNTNSRGDLSKL